MNRRATKGIDRISKQIYRIAIASNTNTYKEEVLQRVNGIQFTDDLEYYDKLNQLIKQWKSSIINYFIGISDKYDLELNDTALNDDEDMLIGSFISQPIWLQFNGGKPVFDEEGNVIDIEQPYGKIHFNDSQNISFTFYSYQQFYQKVQNWVINNVLTNDYGYYYYQGYDDITNRLIYQVELYTKSKVAELKSNIKSRFDCIRKITINKERKENKYSRYNAYILTLHVEIVDDLVECAGDSMIELFNSLNIINGNNF